jgi:UPF0176 protein
MQKIILYYKFAPVADPHETRRQQVIWAAERGLNGRVIVSEHGINGTLGGDQEALEDYIERMEETAEFKGIEYKWSDGGYEDFPKLSIKVRKELVTLAPEDSFDPFDGGTPLRPEEWHEFMANNPDVPILDARNEYESDIGRFKNAIAPKIKTFKELKPHLDKLDKDKPVMTYCTGDIRCEYLSAYMKHKGFKEVYHLDGGIVKYGEKYGSKGYWDGKCFVFDRRMKLSFDDETEDIGTCSTCQERTSDFINCDNKACNKLILMCNGCQAKVTVCPLCQSDDVVLRSVSR